MANDINRISIVPYTPEWQKIFLQEVEKLNQIFCNQLIVFHHIGSTSIPNCAAKPIIDILGVTNDVLEINQFNHALEDIGYSALGEYGIKQRRFFQKTNFVHLHIFEDSDPEVARHLRFRDFLINHPEEVIKYSELKQQLAQMHPTERAQYIFGKESYIKTIDCKAVNQDQGSYWSKISYPRRSIWSQDEILQALDVNMQLEMTYFAKYLSEVEIVYEPDVVVVRSSIPNDTFNYIVGARFTKDNVSSRVQHVLKLFHGKEAPFTWWVSERDMPATLEKELVIQGLKCKEETIGMSLFLDELALSRIISELSIERVLRVYLILQLS